MRDAAINMIRSAAVPQFVKNQSFGDWRIFRQRLTKEMSEIAGRGEFVTLIRYVKPKNISMENIHLVRDDGTIPDVVMEDSPRELQKHLPIWIHGKGHVLKTGLGLGCVVRGLLEKQDVDLVSVIEIDPDIIRVIGQEFSGNDRVKIYHADAMDFDYSTLPKIDFAWHDIWTPENDGLDMMHAKLIMACRKKAEVQGAWGFNRPCKRMFRQKIEMIG